MSFLGFTLLSLLDALIGLLSLGFIESGLADWAYLKNYQAKALDKKVVKL